MYLCRDLVEVFLMFNGLLNYYFPPTVKEMGSPPSVSPQHSLPLAAWMLKHHPSAHPVLQKTQKRRDKVFILLHGGRLAPHRCDQAKVSLTCNYSRSIHLGSRRGAKAIISQHSLLTEGDLLTRAHTCQRCENANRSMWGYFCLSCAAISQATF